MRIILGGRTEERVVAAYAAIDAMRSQFVILVVEGRFGAGVPRDQVLLGLEQFAPLGVALDHFRNRRRTLLDAGVIEYNDRHHSRSPRKSGSAGSLGALAIRPTPREHQRHSNRGGHEPPPRDDFAVATATEGALHNTYIAAIMRIVTVLGFDACTS